MTLGATNNDPQGAAATNTEPNAGTEPATAQNGGSTYNPPATQADLDRIIENRLQRERAKYADYNDLKDKAQRSDAINNELEDLKGKVSALEKENAEYKHNEEVSSWAKEVSEETGIPAELLQGDTKEAMQEQAKALGKYINVSAPVVNGDGHTPTNKAGMATRDLFANALDGII